MLADNIVVAHRGAFKANNLPENSIASLKEAMRLKCRGSEFDIWMTTDDSLVVNHDPDYFKIPIEQSTYKQLLEHRLKNGEKIPTLREYLLAGRQDKPVTQMVLEIKPTRLGKDRAVFITDKVLNLVKELKMEHYSAYISFDYNVMLRIAQLDPKAITQYLNGEKSPAEIKKDGIKGIDYNVSVFRKNPQWINEAKQLGLILNVWTVNKDEDLDYFISQKFDLITTNEPELLLKKTNK